MNSSEREFLVSGKNVIEEAICAEGVEIKEISCNRRDIAEHFQELLGRYDKKQNVLIKHGDGESFRGRRNRHGVMSVGKEQGCRAKVIFHRLCSFSDLKKRVAEDGIQMGDFLILDHLQDPQNLGALMRAAAAFDFKNVVIPKDRACPLTSNAIEVSSGLAFRLFCFEVANLNQVLSMLSDAGWWIFVADQRGGKPVGEVEFLTPMALILGAEGQGVSEGVKKHVQVPVTIPMASEVESLNVAMAGAIVMAGCYAAKRRRLSRTNDCV